MEQFRNLDTQSQVAMVVSVALVANVHLKLVALPSALVGVLRQNKTLLALATLGLAYYDLKMGVVAASLLYVAMNTREGMAGTTSESDPEENKGLLNTLLEVVAPATTVVTTPNVEEAIVAKESNVSDSVSGMLAKPEMEPSSTPLPTQSNDVPTEEHRVPGSEGVHDVDESKFSLVSLPKVSDGEVSGVSENRWGSNLAQV